MLDVMFKEDDSWICKEDGVENVGVIRWFCLNMVCLYFKKVSMRSKFKMVGWVDEFRVEFIFG